MAVLEFNDTDYHNLIDLLVEAVKVKEATGAAFGGDRWRSIR